MEEEKKEIQETEDNSKVEFPLSGVILISVLLVLMAVCIVLIKVL